jgi:hypothetical protein
VVQKSLYRLLASMTGKMVVSNAQVPDDRLQDFSVLAAREMTQLCSKLRQLLGIQTDS